MKFVSRGNGEYLVVAESVESGNVNPLGFNFLSLEYPSYLLQTQTNSFSPLLVVRFGGLKTKEKKIERGTLFPTSRNKAGFSLGSYSLYSSTCPDSFLLPF